MTYDIDYNSRQEGNSATASTYAAITARSYHPDMVNVAFMDGSVRTIGSDIDLTLWRALSTRAGGEIAQLARRLTAPWLRIRYVAWMPVTNRPAGLYLSFPGP